MGRKKKYEEAEALRTAMLLIWQKGYEAVSTRELAAAMGINQYSLYASFESKEILFERALELYLQQIIENWLAKPLLAEGARGAAIRTFFEVFVEPGQGTFPSGCMIFNTMTIEEARRPAVKMTIDKYQALLTAGFTDILRRDFPNASTEEIAAKAGLALCVLGGIAVKKRTGFAGPPVQIVVDQLMLSLYPDKAG
jgi:AcrR family transcriptional regulator